MRFAQHIAEYFEGSDHLVLKGAMSFKLKNGNGFKNIAPER
jgi:hypothetical protein